MFLHILTFLTFSRPGLWLFGLSWTNGCDDDNDDADGDVVVAAAVLVVIVIVLLELVAVGIVVVVVTAATSGILLPSLRAKKQ